LLGTSLVKKSSANPLPPFACLSLSSNLPTVELFTSKISYLPSGLRATASRPFPEAFCTAKTSLYPVSFKFKYLNNFDYIFEFL